mgnify:CR=1 FL=1
MLEGEQITSGLGRREEEEACAREEANFAEAEEMVRELAQQKQSAEAEVARMKAKVLRQEEVAQAAEAQVIVSTESAENYTVLSDTAKLDTTAS